jgi:signal transduction histidine kinase
LPVRFWLWLLLIAVVAVPAVTTLVLIVSRPAPPEARLLGRAMEPALREVLLDQVDDWADPAWQTTLTTRLETAGLAALLIDDTGQIVYRSPGWPARVNAASGERSAAQHAAITLYAPTQAGTAMAMLVAAPASPGIPPESPWFDTELLTIPIAQMAALVLIVAAIAFFVHRAFLRPLAHMVDAMRQVGAGDLDARLPRSRVTEVDDVATAFGTMAGELRTALERQQELEQERRMTIGALVHDLRTPLFSLRGYLEGLATGVASSPEKMARYIRVCQEKADALERLVSDLFNYTRTEYLEEVPRPEPLELGELMRRTVEGLLPQAYAKGVSLALDETAGPVMVAGDPMLLMRAVENVLDNAVRHTPSGGKVRIGWERHGETAEFSVTDTGPGIPLADLPHLFTPFYRGESSRNRRTGGAGLGLAIARRLLQAHGGDLTASNVENGGARFTGTLPTSGKCPSTGVMPATPSKTPVSC